MSKKRKHLHKKSPSWDVPADRARVAELRHLGWSPRHAEMLCAIEIALDHVVDLPDVARARLTDLVCLALSHQPIRLAVVPLYAWPEHEAAWRVLAATAAPPYDVVFAQLIRVSSAVDHDEAS